MDSIDTDHLFTPGRVSVVGPGRPGQVAPDYLAPFDVMVEGNRVLFAGEVPA